MLVLLQKGVNKSQQRVAYQDSIRNKTDQDEANGLQTGRSFSKKGATPITGLDSKKLAGLSSKLAATLGITG